MGWNAACEYISAELLIDIDCPKKQKPLYLRLQKYLEKSDVSKQ